MLSWCGQRGIGSENERSLRSASASGICLGDEPLNIAGRDIASSRNGGSCRISEFGSGCGCCRSKSQTDKRQSSLSDLIRRYRRSESAGPNVEDLPGGRRLHLTPGQDGSGRHRPLKDGRNLLPERGIGLKRRGVVRGRSVRPKSSKRPRCRNRENN